MPAAYDEPAGRPVDAVRWRLGCAGYHYDDWREVFFPPGTPKTRWLAAYAERFDTLEMNNTFHAPPTAERCRKWAEQVPEGFRFHAKLWRGITHDRALWAGKAAFEDFLDAVTGFGDRLGGVLIQLPPECGFAACDDLARLLEIFPERIPRAVEFRSPTWYRPETDALLREHAATRVAAELERHPEAATIAVTIDRLYVRLLGRHARFETEDRELFDPTPLLTRWRDALFTAIEAADRPVREATVIFNNDLAGHAPATLGRFAKLVGIDLPEPKPRQQTLGF